MATIKSSCGGILLDDTTLKNVGKVLTTNGTNSVSSTFTLCSLPIDASKFKKINNVLTDVDATDIGDTITTCGGLKLDTNYFNVENGVISYNQSISVTFESETEGFTVVVKNASSVVVAPNTTGGLVYSLEKDKQYTYVASATGMKDVSGTIKSNTDKTITIEFEAE